MSVQKNKPTKVVFRSRKRLVGVLSSLVIMGLAGSYFLFGVRADSYGIKYDITDVARMLYTNQNEPISKGSVVSLDIDGYFDTTAGHKAVVFINFNSDRSQVRFKGISNCTLYACNKIPWSQQLEHQYSTDQVICLNIPANVDPYVAPGTPKRQNILRIKYEALVDIPARSFDWIGVKTAEAINESCNSYRPEASDFLEGYGTRCGVPTVPECNRPAPRGLDPTPGNNNGTSGTGSGSNGSGTGVTGTGTGGGSSGSTATKQGNKPNSTPASSNQGDKDQTKLDPSPFYDGKEYGRGSDNDSGGVLDLFSSGKVSTATKVWRALVLGIIVTLVVLAVIRRESISRIVRRYVKKSH